MMWNDRYESGRVPRNNHFETLHFKTMWPTFDDYLRDISAIEKPVFLRDKATFELMEQAIGNSMLKFTTREKNLAYFKLKVRDLNYKMERRQQLANIKITELANRKNESIQKLLLVNRTDQESTPSDALEDKFLDNTVTNTTTTTGAPIDTLALMQQMANMQDPEITFLLELFNSIAFPLVESHQGKEFVY